MKKIHEKIREMAAPYQDQRDDEGHAAITLSYAQKLLELEGGNEDIVIPAIILHDIGYSQIPRKTRMLIFDRNAPKEKRDAVRYGHQEESVKLGKKILEEAGYPSELIPEILEIVSQHDTRKGFISKEEGLVRDADKLWRFTPESFRADANRTRTETEDRFKRLDEDLKKTDYIYSQSAREIASRELAERKNQHEN